MKYQVFLKPLTDNKIPLNFLDSILSNNSLYEMFKYEFNENADYFKGIQKNEYLFYMLEYIISKFTSCSVVQGVEYIKRFIDDFFLEELNKERNNIVLTPIFKAIEIIKDNPEIKDLYDYIMEKSDYDKKVNEIEKELDEILKKDKLSISEFELLCNYVKNNNKGYISMNIVGIMLNLHAYKKNHIFDREVVKVLVYSTTKDYLRDLSVDVNIEYIDEVNFENKTYDLSVKTIYIESLLLDTFISGNYVELFSNLFFKMTLYRQEFLLTNNIVSLETLNTLMNMINHKADMSKIYVDTNYDAYSYTSDIKASSFVKALKFYQSFGVDLFASYINSQLSKIEINSEYAPTYNKEISLDIMFSKSFNKLSESLKKELIKKYKVLSLFYFDNGTKKNIIDLFKEYIKTKEKCILEYIETTVVLPEEIIDNAILLVNYHTKDKEISSLIEKLLKFIYQDLFYYSLTNYLKFNESRINFNKDNYLNELYVKVNSIQSNNKLDKFISDILNIIEMEKQN